MCESVYVNFTEIKKKMLEFGQVGTKLFLPYALVSVECFETFLIWLFTYMTRLFSLILSKVKWNNKNKMFALSKCV